MNQETTVKPPSSFEFFEHNHFDMYKKNIVTTSANNRAPGMQKTQQQKILLLLKKDLPTLKTETNSTTQQPKLIVVRK